MADQELHPHIVHHTLAHSYFSHFLLLLAGLVADFILPIKLFDGSSITYIGISMIVVASLVILWAQLTSGKFDAKSITKQSFLRGPYCFTRMPTHWGLFLLILGFGLVLNSFFVFLFSLLSFLTSRLVFIRREEKFLTQRYGDPYTDYKKTVRF